ncbi:MAG: cyclopropane-fatty-acyl-phospholipid synthase family protein [Methylotenera sp.]|nr:cyclopropane-fatty-acyl-phospholipid synthase family protein [Methylotenera sp.]
MIFSKAAIRLSESGLMPDFLIRFGIRQLSQQRLIDISAGNTEIASELRAQFFQSMRQAQIAPLPEMANAQHYEVPAAFFDLVLGKHRKYSSCYWPNGIHHLDDAEQQALTQTTLHADLKNGQAILELGCGWGSLSLWMARHYPNSQITSVSNSKSQRDFILAIANKENLNNLNVITCDMNNFDTEQRFDRVVSVEMFEHMRNYEVLFEKIKRWLSPQGKFFMHIFCHKDVPYAFEVQGDDDWMSQFFFSGGFMPSDDTPSQFQKHLKLSRQWRWDGTHYEKTANAWLVNMAHNEVVINGILADCYGAENVVLWRQRWRIFFMACAELFGYNAGQEWWVGHYLFEKK